MREKRPGRVLYTSTEVRSAVINLFRDGGSERIAISAYVGDGAEAYIPRPTGLQLICSPTPGATNPNALRLLMSKGVFVEFADSLHMKVYWAKGRGAVVTSANLSTNAMGAGGLREAGVLLGPGELDIDRILRQLKRRPAEPELRLLDRQHKSFYSRVGWNIPTRAKQSYKEWFDSPARELWKIMLYWTESYELSDTARESVRGEFGREPHDWLWTERPTVRETDWILCGFIARGKLQSLHWFFAERVFAVPKSDRNYDRDFPYEVVQVHGPKHYPPPPFSANKEVRTSMNTVLRDRMGEETSPFELGAKELRQIYEN